MKKPNYVFRRPAWLQQGRRPDYRFSLANERTFLAWIRTSLALVACAIGIDQFAANLGTQEVRTTMAIGLLLAGAALSGAAYRRWAAAEKAMRNDTDIPFSGLPLGVSVVLAVIVVVLIPVVL